MAGFDPWAGVLTVEFEGTRYEGAEVQLLLDVPMADFMAYLELDTVEKRREWMIEHGVILGWNFRRAGAAVEVSPDTVRSLPFPLIRAIGNAYASEGVSPGTPLDKSSADGSFSPAPSMARARPSGRQKSTG